MASRVVGGPRFRRAMKRLEPAARAEITQALDQCVRMIQTTAIALVPVRTGNLRRALSSPQAIGRRDKGLRVEFGFRTKSIQRKAFYAPFVEYGTKGYNPGDRRVSGRDKRGRQQFKKVKRFVPARPARPFMRPALDLNLPAIRRTLNAAVRRAIARASGG